MIGGVWDPGDIVSGIYEVAVPKTIAGRQPCTLEP